MSRSTEHAARELAQLRKQRLERARVSSVTPVRPPQPPRPAPPARQASSEQTPLENVLQQLQVEKRKPFSALAASFESAVAALWGNKTRSILTMLGIFIGVASVIAMLTLTQGISKFIDDQINSLGANSIIIYPGTTSSRGAQGAGTAQTLTVADVNTVSQVPHVALSSPVSVNSGVQVVYGNQNWNTSVEGVDTNFQEIQNWTMAQGSWFGPTDEQAAVPVAILGDTVSQSLFGATATVPVGQTIRIRDQLFRVGGVLAPKGAGQDDVIFVPFKTSQLRLKNVTYVDQILVEADNRNNIKAVETTITTDLMKNHHLRPGSAADFTTFDFTSYLQRAQQETAIMTLLLVGIAAISLTVGGIGIMNIMLVSVTERTREIGIRMSIGARRRDIQSQFLVEALLLCLTGAIIGLILGLLVGWGITTRFQVPFVITVVTLAVPMAVSIAITVVFGLYPAMQASRLDPVEALRIDE